MRGVRRTIPHTFLNRRMDDTTKTETVDLNGLQMHVERQGAGTPLLLLHGGGGVGENWRRIFDAPPPGYELIIPDLRGHGRSTNPGGTITCRQLAEDVLGLMDALRIEHVAAIGVSLGAKTLLHVATKQPARVTTLVLVSATPYFPEATRALMRAAATQPHDEAEWARMRRWHVHGDEQIRALWSMPQQLADDYEDLSFTPPRLGRISARTMIVHGDRDVLYPLSLAVDLQAGIPGSHLWVIPNGGHGPIFGDMAPVFARTAMAFLNEWKSDAWLT
jgi:pimeloyl-ACP methyl ester carboxylesterase